MSEFDINDPCYCELSLEEWCKKLDKEHRQDVIDNLDTLYDKLMDMFEEDLITLEDDEVWAIQEAIRILKEDDE